MSIKDATELFKSTVNAQKYLENVLCVCALISRQGHLWFLSSHGALPSHPGQTILNVYNSAATIHLAYVGIISQTTRSTVGDTEPLSAGPDIHGFVRVPSGYL